ncbi:Metallopeptidase, M50 family [Waddlia chondrophila 2032/99]|uniref:Metallopeptidase, M50 family n=1 Tax=Waddlia chondrophila 2032/99 TaxID=765953 RepID=F8LEN9_9BACT|nr:Metallopeptidase, M50 family [Waddlia chondrophila 2032/99]
MQLNFGSIPVRIQPFFLVLIFLIGWLSTQSLLLTFLWAFVIFYSVLAHELGHALTAKKFNQSVMIELFGMGGVTYRQGPPLRKWQDFVIVFNGPLAGFSLAAAAYLLLKILGANPPNLFSYLLIVTFNVNLFWTVVNLLPVHPLDGGHLLRILFEGMMGFRGAQAALLLSTLFGLAFSILFFIIHFWIAGALFFMFTFESFRKFQSTLQLSNSDQSEELQALYKEAEEVRASGMDEESLQLFLELRKKAGEGVLFLGASESAAQLLVRLGRLKEAYKILLPISKKLSMSSLFLLHQLAYELGHWKEAATIGNQVFQQRPEYEIAAINSLCHAALGEAEPAVGWLQAAIDAGLPNLSEFLQKREYDRIRENDQFKKVKN